MDIAVSPTPEIVEKPKTTENKPKVEGTPVENKPKVVKDNFERISAVIPKHIINTLRNYVTRTPDKTLTAIYSEALAEYLVNHNIVPGENDKQDIALKRGRRPKVVPVTNSAEVKAPEVVNPPVSVSNEGIVPVVKAVVTTPENITPEQPKNDTPVVVVVEPIVVPTPPPDPAKVEEVATV